MKIYGIMVWMLGSVLGWPKQPDGYQQLSFYGDLKNQSWRDVWWEEWNIWKWKEKSIHAYTGKEVCTGYNVPKLNWAKNAFVQVQLMLMDRAIFENGEFQVNRYVHDVMDRYGGVDSVLLWVSYPNSGIDERNQWDWFRSVPGGVRALKKLVHEFHQHDIKVLLPFNPWDTGTRLEGIPRMYSGERDAMNALVEAIDADGMNGDTMYGVPMGFYNCSKPMVLCPEGGVPTGYLAFNTMSWGAMYWGENGIPPISKLKLLEPRHMVLLNKRWTLDRIPDIQLAYINGIGYETWENIWGIYNAMTKRAEQAVKRVYGILRFFSEHATSPYWKPLQSTNHPSSVFATKFPHPDWISVLWTIIHTKDASVHGEIILRNTTYHHWHFYDVYHGNSLNLSCTRNHCRVGFPIAPFGFGGIAAFAPHHEPHFLKELLHDMKNTIPLAFYSNINKMVPQVMHEKSTTTSTNTDKVIFIPGSRNWTFHVQGVQIEPVPKWTPNIHDYGVGVQFPWENRPKIHHSQKLDIPSFYMDADLITNGDYLTFLQQSQYQPSSLQRFLLHWPYRPTSTAPYHWRYHPSQKNHPVVFVDIHDAQAYAHFYGKRLPHDYEWQYAASNGMENTIFPWGNTTDVSKTLPPKDHSTSPTLLPIRNYPNGNTKSGLSDLMGLVWQMTDSFCDTHTCSILLRGGSLYEPISSPLFDPNWYFPNVHSNFQHAKFISFSSSYDRSSMIGFRTVFIP